MSMEKRFKKVVGMALLTVVGAAPLVHAQPQRSDADMRQQIPATPMSGPAQSPNATTGSGTPAQTTAPVSRSDKQMMNDLAYANLAEIEAGKLAVSKTQNEEVKNFAQKMVTDHTQAMQKLQQLAQDKGVTLPMEPDKSHQSSLKRLGDLSGQAFDRRYMAQDGMDDHKKTHRLLQRVQSRATDPQLKELAAKTLPVVQQHLTMAQELQGTKARSSGSTGAGTSGKTSDRSSSAAGTPGYGNNR